MSQRPSRPNTPAPASSRPEIAEFLERVRALGPASASGQRGRLIFALDATMSRQPTWDTACALQADMFRAAASAGGLDIQLVYFRGLGECRASAWVANSEQLAALMSAIDCRGGHTQIGKVLAHARQESGKQRVQALVYVGDAMEEKIDDLCKAAGELGLLGVPVFMFQEGNDQRGRERLSRDRAALARRLLPLRHRRGASTRRIAARGRGLRLRRHQGAHRAVEAAMTAAPACCWRS